MKIAGKIIAVIAIMMSTSCIKETFRDDSQAETRGIMCIEVTEKSGAAEDRIGTVRFLVFKNAAVSPVLELNELFEVPDAGSGENEVSRFRITLEVSRKINGGDDKMVVAIVNEPATMKSDLDAIETYMQLRDLKLDFTEFLNPDHSGLQEGKLMPMTGVVWTDKVFPTETEAEGDGVALTVFRAAARVDIYIRKETGLDLDLGAGTSIIFSNTYDREYFIRNESGTNSFGQIQTVSSGLISKSHALTSSDPTDLPSASAGNGRLVCSFYTPERTCTAPGNADKLLLDIEVVTSEGAVRKGELVVDRFLCEGVETDIDLISRNNIYRVIVTVGANEITGHVLDWESEYIETEF